jgi:hypothetical protein
MTSLLRLYSRNQCSHVIPVALDLSNISHTAHAESEVLYNTQNVSG